MERTERMTEATAPTGKTDRSYMDWAAILGGAAVATAVAVLFTAFGAALGLSAISAEPGQGSFDFAVILSGIWLAITLVVSYGVGGYIAGRMRRRVDEANADEVTARDGINGMAVWGVGIIVGVMVIGNAVSNTASAVGSAAQSTIEAAGAAAGGVAEGALAAVGAAMPDDGSDALSYVGNTLLRADTVDPETATPETLAADTAAILANVLATGEISDAERAYLESAVAANTGLSGAVVTARVDSAIAAAQSSSDEAARLAAEAEQTAIDLAEAARISAILTAFLITAASLVAGAAATVAAVRGGQHRDQGRIYAGFSVRA